MSTTGLTVEEMIESLTGFEEIGIAKHFDMEWSDLAEAKTQALTLTLKQVNDYFEDDDEVTPDEPDSDGVEQ
jgi:hypothetical protein